MSVYSYTTDSVEVYEEPISYGLLTDTPAEIIDVGSIASAVTEIEDNGSITTTTTTYPFGSSTISGTSDVKFVKNITSRKQELRLTSKSTEGITFAWVGSGTLFEIGGGQERIAAPWVGSSGTLRFVGLSINKGTYSYQNFVVVSYTADDYGLISSAVSLYQDWGSITTSESSEGIQDNGFVIITQQDTSFSTSLKLSGQSSQIYKPSFAQRGSGSLFGLQGSADSVSFNPVETEAVIKISGFGTESYKKIFIGSGSLFNIGTRVEKATYDYNLSSIKQYNDSESYGFIADLFTESDNYGNLTSTVDSGEFDNGYVFDSGIDYPLNPLFKISGESSVIYRPAFAQKGSGSLFSISGGSEAIVFNYIRAGVFEFSGGNIYAQVKPFIGFGSLFNIGSKVEKATYDYNLSSIKQYNDPESYGFIDNLYSESDDYGDVTSVVDFGEIDYGDIFASSIDYPLNPLFKISGESSVIYKPSFAQKGFGAISLFGQESSIYSPAWKSVGEISVYGSAKEAHKEVYIGIGSLFGFDGLSESSLSNPPESTVLYSISGYSVEVFQKTADIKSGSLFGFNGVSESVLFNPPERTILFNIVGAAIQKNTESYVGEGSLFNIGDRVERATYDYNLSSIKQYNDPEAYGEISQVHTQEDDFGLVTSIIDSGEFDNGYVFDSGIDYPLNPLFKISGESSVIYRPAFAQKGSGLINLTGQETSVYSPSWKSYGDVALSGYSLESHTESYIGKGNLFGFSGLVESVGVAEESTTLFKIFGASVETFSNTVIIKSGSLFGFNGSSEAVLFNPPERTALFGFIGSAIQKNTESYVGEGSLFNIGDRVEKATYDYNLSSIKLYDSSESYGYINELSAQEDDFGLVTSIIDSGEFDNGYVFDSGIDYPLNPLFKIFGNVTEIYRPAFAQKGSGLINLTGKETSVYSPLWKSYGDATLFGTAEESHTESYVGVGSLFGFSGLSESVGVAEEFTTLFRISGASVETFSNTAIIKSGSLFGFNGSSEAILFNPPEKTILFTFQGTASERNTESYVGKGSLFNIGDRVEKATYDYNLSSIKLYQDSETYGYIDQNVESYDDYGSVTSVVDSGEIDYGNVFDFEIDYPLNVLFKLSGDSSVIFRPAFVEKGSGKINVSGQSSPVFFSWWRSYGEINITGSAIQKNTESYVGRGNLFGFSGLVESVGVAEASTTLFRISGASTETFSNTVIIKSGSLFGFNGASESVLFNPPERTTLFSLIGSAIEKNVESYVGEGSLFNIGDRVERATYDYNLSSIKLYTDPESYGFVVDTVVQIDDYGNVTSVVDSGEIDNGYIFDSEVDYPLNPLFKISGDSRVIFRPAFVEKGSGQITVSGQETSAISPSLKSYGEINITGKSLESHTESYVGRGNLFGFSGLVESVGVAEASTTLFKISGASTETFQKTSGLEYGSLFAFAGSAEAVSFNTPENTILFNITGSAVQKNTESYIGRGSLFNIGDREERRTYSYNKSSIVFESSDDYGYINELPYEYIDSGFISSSYGEENYGYIISDTTEYPVNILFKISGKSTEIFSNAGSIESGTAYIYGKASDIKFANNWKSFGNAILYGDGIEKNTESYVGRGNLFGFSGLVESVGAAEAFTTLFKISGASVETFSNTAIIKSGSLFGFNGASESVLFNPPERTTLFNIFGKVKESFTESTYIASGQSTFNGSVSDIKLTNANVGVGSAYITGGFSNIQITAAESGSGSLFGYNGAAESKSTNLPQIIGLFNIFGKAKESFTESTYIASGQSTFNGSVSDIKLTNANVGVGSAYITGGFSNIQITAAESGSGSLFGYNGAAESKATDLPAFFGLFTISGSKFESYAKAPYIGSGDFSIYGGLTSEKHTESYVGAGSETLSGEVSTLLTFSWKGTGSLFGFTGASESFGANPPESTALFEISGSKFEAYAKAPYVGSGVSTIYGNSVESHTESYVGTGNTTISGASIDRLLRNNIGSGSYVVYGDVVEKQADSYIGTGSLFSISGGIESRTVDLPEFITLFRIFGSSIESHSEVYNGAGSIYSYGTAKDLFTPNNIGSGSLFAIGGSSESYSISEFSSGLFEISGTVAEAVAPRLIVGGELAFVYGQAKESNTESYVGSGSSTISGESTNRFAFAESGFGTSFVYGSSVERQADDYVGSGSLFGISGVVESSTVIPEEETGLFKIFGSGVEKHTEVYIGLVNYEISGQSRVVFTPNLIVGGTVFVYGSGVESQTDDYVGSGTLFSFLGSEESIAINAVETTALFRVFGNLIEKHTESYVGTGSLFGISGVVESSTISPDEETGLFKIFGSGVEKHTEVYVGSGSTTVSGSHVVKFVSFEIGSGSTFVSGNLIEKQTDDYVGFGTLFGFSGTIEASAVSPDEETGLFKIFGSGVEKHTEVYVGSGTIFEFNGSSESTSVSEVATGLFKVQGASVIRSTFDYVGTGNLFTISGSSEKVTYDLPEFTGLFGISGASTSSVTSNPVENVVQYNVLGGVEDIKLAYAEEGVGSLFGFNGSVVASSPRYVSRNIEGIRIFGSAKRSYTKKLILETGLLITDGTSENEYREYESPFTYVTII